jgi:hypothetical protein
LPGSSRSRFYGSILSRSLPARKAGEH